MRRKRISGVVLTSIAIHFLIVLIAGLFFVTDTQTFKNIVGVDVLNTPEPKPPQVQKEIIKPVPELITIVEDKHVAESIETYPRLFTDPPHSCPPPEMVSEVTISNRSVEVRTPINPNEPNIVNPNTPKLEMTATVDLPVSTLPNTAPATIPSASVPSSGAAPIARGIAGVVQVKVGWTRPLGLSIAEHVGVEESALENVVSGVTLGEVEFPTNNDGDPYGVAIGRGRDVSGGLRFARIRHSLSDWWADSSSLNSLTKWLNEKTKIKTDMNVEGGSIKLTDANLLKSPLLFMTGHDPAFTHSRNLLGMQYGGGKMDSRFTETEAARLRKYLVEKGGFLVFDDCGVNAPAQAMVRLFMSQMRYVMPEYQVQRISNSHKIYHNFYAMGGPPIGFDIFWWGTRPTKRNFLEGFSVGEKLSVLVIRRDYMCAMEAVSAPSRAAHYSPGVYRFMTNVVVYALTTGGISDYSRYIPEEAFTGT